MNNYKKKVYLFNKMVEILMQAETTNTINPLKRFVVRNAIFNSFTTADVYIIPSQ